LAMLLAIPASGGSVFFSSELAAGSTMRLMALVVVAGFESFNGPDQTAV